MYKLDMLKNENEKSIALLLIKIYSCFLLYLWCFGFLWKIWYNFCTFDRIRFFLFFSDQKRIRESNQISISCMTASHSQAERDTGSSTVVKRMMICCSVLQFKAFNVDDFCFGILFYRPIIFFFKDFFIKFIFNLIEFHAFY